MRPSGSQSARDLRCGSIRERPRLSCHVRRERTCEPTICTSPPSCTNEIGWKERCDASARTALKQNRDCAPASMWSSGAVASSTARTRCSTSHLLMPGFWWYSAPNCSQIVRVGLSLGWSPLLCDLVKSTDSNVSNASRAIHGRAATRVSTRLRLPSEPELRYPTSCDDGVECPVVGDHTRRLSHDAKRRGDVV